MDGISSEILVAIIGGVCVVVGTVIGGLISYLTNIHNNKREDDRFEQRLKHDKLQQKSEERKFEQQLEHENRQHLRKYKMNRLHNVLIPIIEIYEKENRLLNDLEETSSVVVIGEGIQQNESKKVEGIIENNKLYMSIDLLKAHNKAEADYEYTMLYDHMSSKIYHLEQKGEQVAPFLFDKNKEFLEKIEEEANAIESKYT